MWGENVSVGEGKGIEYIYALLTGSFRAHPEGSVQHESKFGRLQERTVGRRRKT